MTTPPLQPLHIYRALLREASYLAHPSLTRFHHDHIKAAFRRQSNANPRCETPLSFSPIDLTALPKSLSQQLKRGRAYLALLRRANHGYLQSFENVLRATFARKGKRKRRLIQAIINPAHVATSENKSTGPDSSHFGKEWRPSQEFADLIASHNQISRFISIKAKLKTSPALPTVNRWGRPLPDCRLRNLQRTWLSQHANWVLPPLQESEWQHIHNLATNHEWRQVRRRPSATKPVFAPTHDQACPPLPIPDLIKTSPQALPHASRLDVKVDIGNPHKITDRWLRRITKRTILQCTPTPLANPKTGRQAYRWESGIALPKPVTRNASQRIALFDSS